MNTFIDNGLRAPIDYFNLSKKEKESICNGVGAKGHWSEHIPESILGLSIHDAGNIHDYMIWVSESEEDYDLSDLIFLRNMIYLITEKSGNLFTAWIRSSIALKYFLAVRYKGTYR